MKSMANNSTNKFKISLILLILNCVELAHGSCYRKPQGATGDRSPVDENYQIHIDGNPAAYMPGQQYNSECFDMNSRKKIAFNFTKFKFSFALLRQRLKVY